MSAFGSFEFADDDRMRIYRYVERCGAVTPREAAEHAEVDPETFRHHVAMLKRDGYLAESDGRLRVDLEAGEAEEFESAGLQYVVRPAHQEDTSGVLGAIRAVAEHDRYLVAESVAEQLAYEETLVRHNTANTRLFFVATVREEVVGWCQVEVPRLAKLAHTAELTVGVLAEYRRYGIGSQLLQRGMAWAASEECRRAYNSVPETNDLAIEFLQENGWYVDAWRIDHFEIDGELVDEVMLAVDL
ncbi:MAG: GNAT family N-acetyltransferase [Haloarculaceae archaeon]